MQEPPFKHGLGIHGVTGSFGKGNIIKIQSLILKFCEVKNILELKYESSNRIAPLLLLQKLRYVTSVTIILLL